MTTAKLVCYSIISTGLVYLINMMKRIFIVAFFLLWGCFIYPVPVQAESQSCSYTVSDVTSLLNVQNTIRGEISGGLTRNIVVCLNGGTYSLTSPLQFDNRDSGTGEYSITYQSTSGQSAVISGGKIITTSWNKSGDIWVNTLNEEASFRQIYLDNSRLPRSSQAFTIASVKGQQITVQESADFSNLSPDAEVLALGNFSAFREKIVSGESNTLTVATLMGLGSIDSSYWYIAPKAGQPLYVENDPQYLDQPGEWTLSTLDKTIRYFPISAGEDPNSEQFIYPNLDQLLIIRGEFPSSPVKNLMFKNLIFAHSKWSLPNQGYDGLQAGTYSMSPYSATYFSLPAILTEFTSNLEFGSNIFWHLGSHGLALGQGSNNVKIDGNLFTDIGGNSIMVGYRPQFILEADWNPASLAPQYNDITNNTIYSTANEMWDGVGIFAAFSGFTNISNNFIHDLPYSGISAGFNWGYGATTMKNTSIQNNLIQRTNLKLNDGGGIYVLGNQPDSLMSNNAMTDIYPPDPTGFTVTGIYFDNGSSGWRVQENVTNNWFCSDCQPNHIPADSPSNFLLISNNVYGSELPAIDWTQFGSQKTPPSPMPTLTPSPLVKQNIFAFNNIIPDFGKSGSFSADLDGSGKVDISDYNLLVSDFSKTGMSGFIPADINKDGKVDVFDYNVLVANFGKSQ